MNLDLIQKTWVFLYIIIIYLFIYSIRTGVSETRSNL